MVSFPYYSHTTPIRIPKDMGMVWEAYHKGVPLLGVPENPIDFREGTIQISGQISLIPKAEITSLKTKITMENHHV